MGRQAAREFSRTSKRDPGSFSMSHDAETNSELIRLPGEHIDRLTRPLARFFQIEAAGGVILLVATCAALAVANSPWAHWYEHLWETRAGVRVGNLEFGRTLREWLNDALMTLFFFVVALELKRELVLGEMRILRMAALPFAAALGGMLVPATIYLLLQFGKPGQNGWGTVMATDTAFVIGCLALVGPRAGHGLRVFMLSLAIIDDIGAIIVVTVGYSSNISWVALALAVLGVASVCALAGLGVRSVPVYVLAGSFIWLSVDASGIHATITGVILGLLTPARRWVSDTRLYGILDQVLAYPAASESSGHTKDRRTIRMAEIAARETLSPVERLEMMLHPWVGFLIMPLFALANAGVPLTMTGMRSSITYAVVLGFAIGKPVGILAFSWLALRLGIATRPSELSWRELAGGSLLAGIGFTMALFIANLALEGALLDSAKMGIFVASAVAAIVGLSVLMWAPAVRRSQTLMQPEVV